MQAQPAARKSMRVQPARVYAPPYGGVGAFLWEAVRFKCAGFLIKTGEPFRCGFPAKVRKNDENGKKPLFYRRLFLYSARRVLWEAVRFIMHGASIEISAR